MKNRMNKLAGKMNSMMICAQAALTGAGEVRAMWIPL